MNTIDHCAFNGDADGLCALQQLRLAGELDPQVRLVVKTYARGFGLDVVEVPHDSGVTDPDRIRAAAADAAAVVFQQPNFFGCLEPAPDLAAAASGVLRRREFEPLATAELLHQANEEFGQRNRFFPQWTDACREDRVDPGVERGQTEDRRGADRIAIDRGRRPIVGHEFERGPVTEPSREWLRERVVGQCR